MDTYNPNLEESNFKTTKHHVEMMVGLNLNPKDATKFLCILWEIDELLIGLNKMGHPELRPRIIRALAEYYGFVIMLPKG